MKTNILLTSLVLGTGLLATATLTAPAAVVYDNYTTSVGVNLNSQGLQIGDEISLGGPVTGVPGADHALLTRFQFNAWANDFTGNPTIQAQVRFYANDGAPLGLANRPGTQLWDSGLFPILLQTTAGGPVDGLTTYYNIDFLASDLSSGLQGVVVPKDFTWSVQFSSLGAGSAGVPLYSPPTVGNNFTDYWVNTGSPLFDWTLRGGPPPGPYDFQASFEGIAVPEPAPMLTMGCVIALGGFVAWRSRSKSRATA